jgi:integrase
MSITAYIEDGQKLYEVFVKGRDNNGKQVARRKRGVTSERKAKEVEFEFKKELEAIAGAETPWTWGDWYAECLKRMKLTFKKSTVELYDGCLKKWLPADWSKKELPDFTKTDIYEFIFETMSTEASMNLRRATFKRIHRIFAMAVEEGILVRNPANGITVKVPEPEQAVLNSNEADLLLIRAKESCHRFYPIWAFALMTGMRSGEMYALRWSDIDLETGLISITKQWTSKDGIHATKANRNRVVPINPDLRRFLTELKLMGGYTETLWDGVNKCEVTYKDYVLPRLVEWHNGEQAAVLEDFCKSIGVTEVKFHDLRATFITNMLAQGVSLVAVMAIVGHRKMSTTDKYVRLAGVGIQGATEKLGYRIPEQNPGKVIQLVFPKGSG